MLPLPLLPLQGMPHPGSMHLPSPRPHPGSMHLPSPRVMPPMPSMPSMQAQSWKSFQPQAMTQQDYIVTPRQDYMVTPRDVLTHIDDVVSEMERELTDDFWPGGRSASEPSTAASQGECERHRSRNSELERELADLRAMHEKQCQQNRVYQDQIAELEGQVADMQQVRAGHQRQQSFSMTRIAELEQALGSALAVDNKRLQEQDVQLSRIAALEEEVRSEEQVQQKQRFADSMRIQELEGLLAEAEETHRLQHCNDCERIQCLEQEQGEMRCALEEHCQLHKRHQSQIIDLEEVAAAAQAIKENNNRQQTAHISKIKELELTIDDLRASEERHARQNCTQRKQLANIEEILSDTQASERSHASRHETQRAQIIELERLLNDAEVAEERNKWQQKSLRQQVTDLEKELSEVRVSSGSSGKHNPMDRTRILELEQELQVLRASETSRQQQNMLYRSKVSELERELEDHKARISTYVQRHEKDGERTRMLQQQIDEKDISKQRDTSALVELERRFTALSQDLNEERRISTALRTDLQKVQSASETVQRDSDQAVSAMKTINANTHAEFVKLQEELKQANDRLLELRQANDRLQEANDRIRELELLLKQEQQQKREEKAQAIDKASARLPWLPGRSIACSSFTKPSVPLGSEQEFLPKCSHPFASRVRTAAQHMAEALSNLNGTYSLAVESQLACTTDLDLPFDVVKQAMANYPRRQEVETAQRAASAKIEAQINDLRALREELRLQHGLTFREQEEIAQHLDADITICEDELEFLRSELVLTDLPYEVLMEIAHVHIHGSLPERPMGNGQYVLHQATRLGRRDAVEYLLGMPGARDCLHAQDGDGNTPLQCARQQPALQYRLREALRQGEHSSLGRWPGLEPLDKKYEEVLLRIETTGWESLAWKDGFTMLHWAAGKGHGQVCQYLLHLRADPTKLDERSRSAADVAVHAAQRFSDLADMLNAEESKQPRQELRFEHTRALTERGTADSDVTRTGAPRQNSRLRLKERASTSESYTDMSKAKTQDLQVSRDKSRSVSFGALQERKSEVRHRTLTSAVALDDAASVHSSTYGLADWQLQTEGDLTVRHRLGTGMISGMISGMTAAPMSSAPDSEYGISDRQIAELQRRWGGELSSTAEEKSRKLDQSAAWRGELSGTAGDTDSDHFEAMDPFFEELRYELQNNKQAHRRSSAMMSMQPSLLDNDAAAGFSEAQQLEAEERWQGGEAYVQEAGRFLHVK